MHARTYENSLPSRCFSFSFRVSLRRVSFSLILLLARVEFLLSVYLSVSLFLSPRLSAASQTLRSFLASAESPPTGVTTIDYRRVWGRPGEVARGGRGSAVMWGCARMASSRFMALDRRHNPTIRRLYNFESVWGDAANIAFSVVFLSCVPLRLFLFFFWRLVAALPSTTGQPWLSFCHSPAMRRAGKTDKLLGVSPRPPKEPCPFSR